MTPEQQMAEQLLDQAHRHMPLPGNEHKSSRLLDQSAGRLWVRLGVRTVYTPDETRYEADGRKISRKIGELIGQVLFCAMLLLFTHREVAGHGATGEPWPAFTYTGVGFQAHETPGGELYPMSILSPSFEEGKKDMAFATMGSSIVSERSRERAKTPGYFSQTSSAQYVSIDFPSLGSFSGCKPDTVRSKRDQMSVISPHGLALKRGVTTTRLPNEGTSLHPALRRPEAARQHCFSAPTVSSNAGEFLIHL